MDAPIPFFYYDILARLIPGAATVVVLMVRWWPQLTCYVGGPEGWKTAVIPILFAATAYIIGTIYEAFDYAPVVKIPVFFFDAWAFRRAANRFGKISIENPPDGVNNLGGRESRAKFWMRVGLDGTQDPARTATFAHCHRIQAEYKMFLHLIYPSLFLVTMSIRPLKIAMLITGVVGALLCGWVAFHRNDRRWWQALFTAEKAFATKPPPSS